MTLEQVLAIIPARGGSKTIYKKNIQPLNGKPLLAYTIQAAKATPSIIRVVVSTDDAEIAAMSEQYGVEVILRPAEISGDSSSSEEALLHTINYLRNAEDYQPDLVVFLQATSPLRSPDDIQNAIDTLHKEDADSLFSACHIEGFVWRSAISNLQPVNYDPLSRPRRQELQEEILEENGSIYIFKPWILREFNSRLGGKIAVYRMSRITSFQVDVSADLDLMGHLLPALESKPKLVDLTVVQLVVLDFDGVMTDNRALVDQNGKEAVWVNRGDGWGIARLKEAGIEISVISTETNPVVAARCRKLNIACVQGCDDKLTALQEIAKQRCLAPEQIAYVGNDVNDLACMRWVSVPIAVADSMPEVRSIAKLITQQPGGYGAVREVAEWILGPKF